MPSYSSVINSLLRLFPSEKANQYYRAVIKLHPQSEPLANSHLTRSILDDQLQAWITRHAWEACRGWNWPFWINAQTHGASNAFINLTSSPLLANIAARDAAPINGIPETFSGLVDRRGMVTPPHGRFSVETWFRFADGMVRPASILDDAEMHVTSTATTSTFKFPTPHARVEIKVSASGADELKHVHVVATCSANDNGKTCPASIYFAIRPYTPEGVVPIHDLVYNSKGFWMSDSKVIAWLPQRPDISWASDAHHGDAAFFIADPPERTAVRCPAGLATAISGLHLPLREAQVSSAEIVLPLEPVPAKAFPFAELIQQKGHHTAARSASFPAKEQTVLRQAIRVNTGSPIDEALILADHHLSSLTDISVPAIHQAFLYRSEWLAAAVRALLYQGHQSQAARLLQLPLVDIQKNGNLGLAGGKWSLHGQVLTAAADYHRLTQAPRERPVISYTQLRNIARWVMRKRREIAHAPEKPQGLFPPGVTRSNHGIEYQLTDNLWALQGIASAGWLARYFQEHRDAEVLQREAGKFAGNIAAAMHRELEYSLTQQVPGRLHRTFDPATASEILEIALMPDAWRMVRADSWLPRLIDYLHQPLSHQPSRPLNYMLRQIDSNGVYPLRRMLLCLAMIKLNDERAQTLFTEILPTRSPLNTWPECLNPHTGMGTGRDMADPGACSAFAILVRELILQEDDEKLTFSPQALAAHGADAEYDIDLKNAPTFHGNATATINRSADETSLSIISLAGDPNSEIQWREGSYRRSLGSGAQALGVHVQKLSASINNHSR